MRSAVFVLLPGICLAGLAGIPARAADATTTLDATQRNTPYAPAATVTPEKQSPAAKPDPSVQEKRFQTQTVERKSSPLLERRAPIDLRETREKNVINKDSHRPEAIEQPRSAFNHQPAGISTGDAAAKPPLVAKYQDSLKAASASNMGRFPAFDQATSAKINRFVFRKNPTDAPGALGGAAVTPAAGGSSIQK